MFLLDTNVISEVRKGARGIPALRDWSKSTPTTSLYLSVVTLLEIERGILSLERRDRSQGDDLHRWLHEGVVPDFTGRILPVNTAIALRSARLHVANQRPYLDAIIAATALEHGLTVVTRNVRDFFGTGAPVINPFEPISGILAF